MLFSHPGGWVISSAYREATRTAGLTASEDAVVIFRSDGRVSRSGDEVECREERLVQTFRNRPGMAAKKPKQPQRGFRRVASWIYEAINPLIVTIPTETAFLESGNVTRRFHSGSPEYLRPIEGYLAPEARRILDDFRMANCPCRSNGR